MHVAVAHGLGLTVPYGVTKRAASTSRATAIGASASSAKCKPESRNKPTKTAIQISDADRRRRILITDKCTTTFQKWRDTGESFRVDRYRCIAGRCLCEIMSVKTKVTKTKTALRVR